MTTTEQSFRTLAHTLQGRLDEVEAEVAVTRQALADLIRAATVYESFKQPRRNANAWNGLWDSIAAARVVLGEDTTA